MYVCVYVCMCVAAGSAAAGGGSGGGEGEQSAGLRQVQGAGSIIPHEVRNCDHTYILYVCMYVCMYVWMDGYVCTSV